VHPAVIDAYMDRSLVETLKARTERELRESVSHLSGEEGAVLALLQQRMERELTPRSKSVPLKTSKARRKNKKGARS
jgi:DNA topoisomerase-1